MSRLILNHIRLLFLAMCMLVLAACGQKGELYLPDEAKAELGAPTRSS